MNIAKELLKEKVHTKSQALKISNYACSSSANFTALVECFLSNEYRLAQRAAWSVSWAAKKYPEIIQPHIGALISGLKRKDVHDAVIRNTVKVLQDIEIPEKYHGEVMHACFSFIENPETAVAIKVFSMTILSRISKFYPEIKNELKLIIEARWNYETAAFKSRAKKVLKELILHVV